ncbi:MAG TPA: hypothetical protein VLV84_03950 [Candidatus Acidoferrales bacterium]|nr:hypothetical protein [Candidatus Acidoferrales bacterium]
MALAESKLRQLRIDSYSLPGQTPPAPCEAKVRRVKGVGTCDIIDYGVPCPKEAEFIINQNRLCLDHFQRERTALESTGRIVRILPDEEES